MCNSLVSPSAGGDTHPLFCLQRQLLGETHTCKWPSPAPDLRWVYRRGLGIHVTCFSYSCSCCSSSLFDSSLVSEAHKDDISVAVPITPQHICTEAVMITPAMKKVCQSVLIHGQAGHNSHQRLETYIVL